MENAKKTAPAFEAEVGMEGFFELLELRESGEAAARMDAGLVRRAVFVTRLYDSKSTTMGVPSVKRYVTASFAYGEDLVTSTRVTSVGIEMPEGVKNGGSPQKVHDSVYEEMRSKIAGRIEERGWEIPLLDGHVHHAGAVS